MGRPTAARCLRFISTGEAESEETCADYLDLLYLPGEEAACACAAWTAVNAMTWDLAKWVDLPSGSPLLNERSGWPAGAHPRLVERGSCPVAELEGGFDSYLARLSAKTRMRARQEMRKAERVGMTLELADAATVEACFADLVRLHQQRWNAEGKPGCFASARFTQFHRRLVHEWIGSGRVVLARLSCEGKACAVLYGFVTGTKFDLYQLGVVPMEGAGIHSPGLAANMLLMEHLAAGGITHYDFLRGTVIAYAAASPPNSAR